MVSANRLGYRRWRLGQRRRCAERAGQAYRYGAYGDTRRAERARCRPLCGENLSPSLGERARSRPQARPVSCRPREVAAVVAHRQRLSANSRCRCKVWRREGRAGVLEIRSLNSNRPKTARLCLGARDTWPSSGPSGPWAQQLCLTPFHGSLTLPLHSRARQSASFTAGQGSLPPRSPLSALTPRPPRWRGPGRARLPPRRSRTRCGPASPPPSGIPTPRCALCTCVCVCARACVVLRSASLCSSKARPA